MKRKLCSKRGETLVEGMVSLVVIVLVISMLPLAIETAAKINYKVSQMETICPKSMTESTKAESSTVSVKWGSEEHVQSTIQGYTESGFSYYVESNGVG